MLPRSFSGPTEATKATLLFTINDPAFFLSHRLAVARAAQAAGCDVAVAGPSDGLDGIEKLGFPTYSFPLRRESLDPRQEARTRTALVRLYEDLRPDIVHHVTIKPVIHGSHAARKTGVPAVVNAITGLGWTFTGSGPRAGLTRFVVHRGYRQAFRHPNQLAIFQNHDDRDLFVEKHLLPETASRVILGSGVDPDYWVPQPGPQGVPLVLLPGRLLVDKGVPIFVKAAHILRQRGVEARFGIVGPEDHQNRGAIPPSQLDAWRDEGVVELWGHHSDMRAAYAQATVVCLPSNREGVPRALIEAASMAKPIVATDVPGCREIVANGVNGELVPPGEPDALANALQRVLEDESLRMRYSQAGRQRVLAQFTEQHVINATLGVYDCLLERRGRKQT